jgi:AraC-like DNA-binding protein
MAEPTVSAGLVRGLMTLAASKGADPGALARLAQIDPADLEDQDARLPLARYVALMRAGQALTGDTALSLHYAEEIDMAEFSVVGLIAHASETMLDAFFQLNRYGRLVVEVEGLASGERYSLEHDADGLWVIDHRRNPNDFPELTESSFARMVVGSRGFVQGPLIKRVQVTHPEPPHRAEYDRLFAVPVAFDAPRNAMLLDGDWLMNRVQAFPRYVFGVLSARAQALLAELESARTVRGQVEALLMPVLHTGEVGMDTVAGRMGMSRQTLFRRLKAEGATFEQVLDALRHRLAVDYLQGRKVSVNETAYLVGFSEPAAFSRAFKRWTGRSPRNARG